MIKKVESKKDLKKFVYYIKNLYENDNYFVLPLLYIVKKELNKAVLVDKTYQAILSVETKKIQGRLLFTYDHNKKLNQKVCYYSFFDAVNDKGVVKELFDFMENDMKEKGVTYSEGTYTPYDADTRRGILVEGFQYDPTIFTSYNYSYYGPLLEEIGYRKVIDTVSLSADVNENSKKRLKTISKFFLRSNDVRIDPLNWKHLERDFQDVHQILLESENEIIYQETPSIDTIAATAKQLKLFIDPNLIRIARENKSNKPIGFCLVLPDFNQVFKKTKGKIKPFAILRGKKKITRARGTMQYIIPEYQNSGLIGHMFKIIFDELVLLGINEFEAGTMMENNPKPINAFKKFGGEIIRTYRIYGKELQR